MQRRDFGAHLLCATLAGACEPRVGPPRLFVAKSLELPAEELVASGAISSTTRVVAAGSQSIARQVEACHCGDAIISADPKWIDWLERRELIVQGSRFTLVRNQLVLAAHRDSPLQLTRIEQLPGLRFRALHLGDPDVVPAGRYARQALTAANLWEPLRDRLQPAVHVRAAMAPVTARRDHLALVYRTDAQAEEKVKILHAFDPDQPRIVYTAARLATAASRARSVRLLAQLSTPSALRIFRLFGFLPPAPLSAP